MTYEVVQVDTPEQVTHYKFTTYKTVEGRSGNKVEIKDSERQYTLEDLNNRKDKAQAQVDEWESMIESINNL